MQIFPGAISEIDRFSSAGSAIGFGHFATGNVQAKTTYAAAWSDLYAAEEWARLDPVIQKGMTTPGVQTWNLAGRTDDFGNAAQDFDVASGVVISSIIGGHQCIAGVTCKDDLSGNDRAQILQATRAAHLSHLIECARTLTSAQHELVNLFALGLRAKQVAAEFEISADAVKQRKLTIQKTIGVDSFLVAVNVCSRLDAMHHLKNHG